MSYDQSADERFRLDTEIRYLEEQMDEMRRGRNRAEEHFEHQRQQFNRNFEQINQLHHELEKLGDTDAKTALVVSKNIQQSVNNTLNQTQREVDEGYRIQGIRSEESRETLYKKRSTLPW